MFMKTLSIEACFLSLTGLEVIIDIPKKNWRRDYNENII